MLRQIPSLTPSPIHQATRECPRDPMIDANAFVFSPQRLTRQHPSGLLRPQAGELYLWRFRYGWLPVTVQKGESWLSHSERERAKLGPNASLRKRFTAGRVVSRWIASNLLGTDPRDVQLVDGQATHTATRLSMDVAPLYVDIAYGGIWIVIGIASATLGIGITMPTPSAITGLPEGARSSVWPLTTPGRVREMIQHADRSQQQARLNSLPIKTQRLPEDFSPCTLSGMATARFVTVEAARHWHVVDVPMPGEIRAAVSLGQPIRKIQAFGWNKT